MAFLNSNAIYAESVNETSLDNANNTRELLENSTNNNTETNSTVNNSSNDTVEQNTTDPVTNGTNSSNITENNNTSINNSSNSTNVTYYTYTVKVPYKYWYKVKVKVAHTKYVKQKVKTRYKSWYKYNGKWRYKWKYKYTYKWVKKTYYTYTYKWTYTIKYKTETRTTTEKPTSTAASVTTNSNSPYLKSSKNCQVTDASIKSLASSLTKGVSSYTAKATKIFNWVRDHLSYSFYYNTKYGAVNALKYRKGNCVDHAHLVTALMRAAGITTRYAHGTCKFSSGTYGHVWAEVYLGGKWIKADATSSRNSLGVVKSNSVKSMKGYYSSLPF